jgi:hypothetical protein
VPNTDEVASAILAVITAVVVVAELLEQNRVWRNAFSLKASVVWRLSAVSATFYICGQRYLPVNFR